MKLLCIGDSNTYGYDPRSYIGDRYPAEVRWTDRLEGCEVINCGVNGMTVPRGQTRYPGLIRMNEPDLVSVMLGTNDLCSGLSAGQVAGRMEAFLGTIIDTGSRILLISPPVLQFGDWVMDDDKIEESQDLGGVYRELADRMRCLFADAGTWGIDILFDGVHFSPEGHAAFARELQAVLDGMRQTED